VEKIEAHPNLPKGRNIKKIGFQKLKSYFFVLASHFGGGWRGL